MGINKVLAGSLNDPSRIVSNQMRQMQRNIRELKTPQKVGADILTVQSLPNSSSSLAFPGGNQTYTITAGKAFNIIWHWTPNTTVLTLWNFLISVYVDPVSFNANGIADAAHRYPDGQGITSGIALNFKVSTWMDWAASSDTTNMRALVVNMVNNDSVSHQVTVYLKAYLPNINQAA